MPDRLESVAEGSVAQIMHQRRGQGTPLSGLRTYTESSQDLYQLPCGMKNPNAVSQARMAGTRINQIRETELLYTAQALERASLNDAPESSFKFVISLEIDEIM